MTDGEAPVVLETHANGAAGPRPPLTPALVVERACKSPAALLDDDVLAYVVALDDLALMRLRQGLADAGAKLPAGWQQLIAERRRARSSKANSAERPVDDRPRIRVVQGELPRAVEELCAAFVEGDPEVFRRGDELVTIEREPDRREPYEADARRGSSVLTRSGTPRVRAMPFGQLQLRAARVAEWARMDKKSGEWGPCDPDTVVLGAFRDSPEAWRDLPPLKGVVETQFFSPSFRLVDRPGYDEETAHFLVPSCDPGPIEEKPPRSASNAALRYMWTEMACDIPFAGIGDEATAADPERVLQWQKALSIPSAFIGVSAVLTLIARTAIIGAVPAHIFEAASQGSGKTLQMNTVAMIATGRPAPLATYPMRDGRPNEEELEKMLAAYALFGARMIAFDNIKGSLGGQAIEKRLTVYGEDTFRILGKTEPRTLPWHALLMFALNNASMTDDMANRSLISRVESDREDPRRRPASSFYRPDLLVSLRERRPKLVRAALVILRSYLAHRAAGETGEVEGDTMGNFEAWARLVPTAIRWAGGPDILRARPESGGGSDEEAEAHAALLRGWADAWQGQRSAFVLGEAFRQERDIQRGSAPPDGLEDVRGAIRSLTRTPEGRPPSPHAFGMALKRLTGKIRDGRKVTFRKDGHDKVGLWSVVKVAG